MCEEWQESFEAFRDWALQNGYADDLEIDRRENDLGYSPENCRWATRAQQMMNTRKRRNALSQFRGVSLIKPTGKWRATGVNRGVSHHLGVFVKEEDAALAYDAWAKENFGEFASLNFPTSHGGGECCALQEDSESEL